MKSELYKPEFAEHFFRYEYGKIVSIITRYLGTEQVETAEDLVQEALTKAVEIWPKNGTPDHPEAWLFITAKNLALNVLKRQKQQEKHSDQISNEQSSLELDRLEVSEEIILDEQLKMMFVCCHSSIPENSQIALILKILCGFSIAEIASAFMSSNEAINKRLVRGRRVLRENKIPFDLPSTIEDSLPIVLKTTYLLFNEGYSPSQKSDIIHEDLCFEAIRLCELLVQSKSISNKSESYALLALMYLNASRFEARFNMDEVIITMEQQDRSMWDQGLISKGLTYLNQTTEDGQLSRYLILASISAHHCMASSIEDTDWNEILVLYDNLLTLEDSPITRLNRSVALGKAKGASVAIADLKHLEAHSDIGQNFLFHAVMANLYLSERQKSLAVESLQEAIEKCSNERDLKFLKKKLEESSLFD